MEWISVKEKKPENMILAIVSNEKGWMHGSVMAIYHATEDAWVLYDPDYRHSILLEVSHYLPVPEFKSKFMG